jgi:hypothetical protein
VERNILHVLKRRANGILRSNGLLKHVIKRKIEGRMKAMGRRGRRRKQILNQLQQKRGYLKLVEEALNQSLWKTHLEGVYGPLCDQIESC